MFENNGFSTKTLDCALELVRSFSIYSLTHQKDANGTILPVNNFTVDTESSESLYFTPSVSEEQETRKPFNYDTFGNWEYSATNVHVLELEPTICVFISNMLNLQTEIMRELLVD